MLNFILNHKKIIGAVTGVIAVLTGLYQLHDMVYENGYKAAQAKMQAEYARQVELMQEQYQEQINTALSSQAVEFQSELDRIKNEREIVIKTQTVTEYVDKIVEIPAQCDPVIDDVIRMLNQATGIIHSASNECASSQDTC